MENLQNKKWWMYVHNDLRELLTQSRFLIDNLKKWEVDKEQRFQDYAFIVFPAAKAYEGFLKTLFLTPFGILGKTAEICSFTGFLTRKMQSHLLRRKIG